MRYKAITAAALALILSACAGNNADNTVITDTETSAENSIVLTAPKEYETVISEAVIEPAISETDIVSDEAVIPMINAEDVSRITVIPEFLIPQGYEPFTANDRAREALSKCISKMIDLSPAKADFDINDFTGGGYVVTVFENKAAHEFVFMNEEYVRYGKYYYSIEPSLGLEIIGIITDILSEAKDAETKYNTLTKAEDEMLRNDYAFMVSERDNCSVTADDVYGEFYYGNDNGYYVVVMCPSYCYTEDMQYIELRFTDEDSADPTADLNPYVTIPLPSGSFEMLVYKDGLFTDIVTAVENKYISYDMVQSIEAQMDDFYNGDRRCRYTVE